MMKIKCPICGNFYISHDGVYGHMQRSHADEIPEGMPADQYFYDLTHKGKVSKCVICKRPTKWNERTHKYHRLCDSPACREKNRKIFQERMMKIHGTDNLAKDPEHQQKMLHGRSISGEYEWSSGGKTQYVGSYEKDFLEICDNLLNLHQSDVIPSPHVFKYVYDNATHFYMPDFYIPDIKLEVEIKDGGDNPNMHHKIQAVDKEKERLKDKVLINQHEYHYIKVVNKKYEKFLALVSKLIAGDISVSEEREKIKIV